MKSLLPPLLLGLAQVVFGQTPTITAVQDAGGYSSNLAQGSIFVVKGTNLSASGFSPALRLPLETTLANVKITFTPQLPGPGVDAYMVYTYNVDGKNQLAGLLPSNVTPGDHFVTVNNNGVLSAPFRITVVGRKFGIITQDSSGTGNAVVQNFVSGERYDINRLTTGTLPGSTVTHSPSHPGQVIVIWGTGLGAVPGTPDNIMPGAQDLRSQTNISVLIGGQSITPDIYAGRAPSLPGTDEIILTLPSNVPTGCTVSLQVNVNNVFSNVATIAIAPAGAAACVSPAYSQDVLTRLDRGGTINAGVFAMTSFISRLTVFDRAVTATTDAVAGGFSRISGAQLATAVAFQNPPGSCQEFRRVGDPAQILLGANTTNLDAGNAITLSGPNVVASANQLTRGADKFYSLALGTSTSPFISELGFIANPVIAPGNYRLTGTGGADVGAFTANVTVGPRITVTPELPATIDRSSQLTVGWTGGASSDTVLVAGYSGVRVSGVGSTSVYEAGVFLCSAPASAGRLVIPARVLSNLPPTPPDLNGIGLITVLSTSSPSASSGLFSAPLAAGGNIDTGLFLAATGYATNTQYQ